MKSPLSLPLVTMLLACGLQAKAQSFEVMPGTERVFADVQWLKTFDAEGRWSLFSRTRATVDYDENTDLFSGAYLNYTTPSGFGGSIVGRISTNGTGADVGAHFFKASEKFVIFALASVEASKDLGVSWFSILRYTPAIGEKWRLYTSLELFSNFGSEGHNASVQRMRLGLSRRGYQFGPALNLAGFGEDYSSTNRNPGLFVRKQF